MCEYTTYARTHLASVLYTDTVLVHCIRAYTLFRSTVCEHCACAVVIRGMPGQSISRATALHAGLSTGIERAGLNRRKRQGRKKMRLFLSLSRKLLLRLRSLPGSPPNQPRASPYSASDANASGCRPALPAELPQDCPSATSATTGILSYTLVNPCTCTTLHSVRN